MRADKAGRKICFRLALIPPVKATLDLRFDGRLPHGLSAVFEDISYNCRSSFNEVVAGLSAAHTADLDWWVQGPASRNTLASPFFHYYCCLHLVRQLIQQGGFAFGTVIVDSRVMRRLIQDIVRDAGIRHCAVRVDVKAHLRRIKHEYLATPVFFVRRLFEYYLARSTRRPTANVIPAAPVVLIDRFVTPAYVTDDRWYGALWVNLTDNMKKETYFVPTVVRTPLRSTRTVYSRLRQDERNVLIKDDYLSVNDIIFAFQHKRRIKRLSITPFSVLGCDVSGLVREELATNRDTPTTTESILTYHFIKRLRQSDARIRLSIDWFEGQVIDKAWNLAVKRYYPNAKRIGYRAFESSPFYLCSYPTLTERQAEVIPDVIAVQGRGRVSDVREFLPGLDVMVIPSFRSPHMWQRDPRLGRNTGVFTVLVALPISIQVSVRIIERLIELHRSGKLGEKPLQFIVKPHPAVGADTVIGQLQSDIPQAFILSKETSFVRLLREASLLITEASSTCLEAIAWGIPVIIVGNDEGLTYDPVPDTVPQHLYRKTRTEPDLLEAIKYYTNLPAEVIARQMIDGEKIKNDYFEPITKEGIERFMDVLRH
jgi:hypothetical protein